MTRRASPVTEISVFATEISVTGIEIFPYEHSSPVTGKNRNLKDRPLFISVTELKYQLTNRAEISHMNGNRAEISAH